MMRETSVDDQINNAIEIPPLEEYSIVLKFKNSTDNNKNEIQDS